jgi:hypothetical protein
MSLSYMQEMGIREPNGQCRCPYCGKFRKRSDFPEQSGHIEFKVGDPVAVMGHIHVPPSCRFCMPVSAIGKDNIEEGQNGINQ